MSSRSALSLVNVYFTATFKLPGKPMSPSALSSVSVNEAPSRDRTGWAVQTFFGKSHGTPMHGEPALIGSGGVLDAIQREAAFDAVGVAADETGVAERLPHFDALEAQHRITQDTIPVGHADRRNARAVVQYGDAGTAVVGQSVGVDRLAV